MPAGESPTARFDRWSIYCSLICAKCSGRVEGRLVKAFHPAFLTCGDQLHRTVLSGGSDTVQGALS